MEEKNLFDVMSDTAEVTTTESDYSTNGADTQSETPAPADETPNDKVDGDNTSTGNVEIKDSDGGKSEIVIADTDTTPVNTATSPADSTDTNVADNKSDAVTGITDKVQADSDAEISATDKSNITQSDTFSDSNELDPNVDTNREKNSQPLSDTAQVKQKKKHDGKRKKKVGNDKPADTQKLYGYGLKSGRPIVDGAPRGYRDYKKFNTAKFINGEYFFSIVYYEKPLTDDEISDYDLVAITDGENDNVKVTDTAMAINDDSPVIDSAPNITDTALATTTPAEINESPTLEKLVDEIKTRLEQNENYLRQWGNNTIEIGQMLIQAKSLVKHGDWANWIDENFALSQETARKYMRVAERFGNSNAHWNLNAGNFFELLALPAGTEENFIDEQTAAGNDVGKMTVRKLKEEVKKYKHKDDTNTNDTPAPVEVVETETNSAPADTPADTTTDTASVILDVDATINGGDNVKPADDSDFVTLKVPADVYTKFANYADEINATADWVMIDALKQYIEKRVDTLN